MNSKMLVNSVTEGLLFCFLNISENSHIKRFKRKMSQYSSLSACYLISQWLKLPVLTGSFEAQASRRLFLWLLGASLRRKEFLCIQITQLTHTMFNFKYFGSQVTIIRSNPKLLLTFQRTEPWIPSICFTLLLSLASGLLTAKAKWISFVIHSLQIAFECRSLQNEITLGRAGI